MYSTNTMLISWALLTRIKSQHLYIIYARTVNTQPFNAFKREHNCNKYDPYTNPTLPTNAHDGNAHMHSRPIQESRCCTCKLPVPKREGLSTETETCRPCAQQQTRTQADATRLREMTRMQGACNWRHPTSSSTRPQWSEDARGQCPPTRDFYVHFLLLCLRYRWMTPAHPSRNTRCHLDICSRHTRKWQISSEDMQCTKCTLS